MNHSLLGRSEHSLIIELRFISNIRQFGRINFHGEFYSPKFGSKQIRYENNKYDCGGAFFRIG